MRRKQSGRRDKKLGSAAMPRYNIHTTKLRDTLPNIFVKAVERDSTPLSHGRETSLTEYISENLSDDSDDEGFICKKCRNGNKQNEGEIESGDLTINNVSAAVFAIAHQLRKSKERRKCLLEQEKIKEIKIRVNDALEHAGMDEMNDEDENIGELLFLDQEKEKRNERKLVTDKFTLSEKLSKSRNNLMLDIDSWLYYLQEDLERLCQVKKDNDDVIIDEQFSTMNEALKKSNIILLKISKAFKKHLSKSQKLSVKQEKSRPNSSKSTKALISRDLDSQNSHESSDNNEDRLNISSKVHTEKELSNPKSLKQALRTIVTILDDGSRNSSSMQARKNYKLGSKQFKAIGGLIDRKNEYITEIEQQNRQLNDELASVKFFEQQKKADAAQIRQLKEENNSLKEQIKELLSNIDELKKRPSISRHNSRHTERRVSIQLPYEQEASVEIFVENSEDDDKSDNRTTTKQNTPRRTMVSRTYLQTKKSNLKNPIASQQTLNRNPSTNLVIHTDSVDKNSESVTKTASTTTPSIIPPAEVEDLSTNDVKEKELPMDTEKVITTRVESTTNKESFHISRENTKQSTPLSLSEKIPEGNDLKAQVSYFRGMLRNTEQTIADQQKEIERLLYAKTERKPSTVTTPNLDAANVKSSKSIGKSIHKKIELLEHQLKKTKQDQENATHDLKVEKRNNDYLRLELQKLLLEKEKLERKLYKESTAKLETSEVSRDQLLKRFRNESEKELQRLRAYIINEQHRHDANLRRIHADHKNTVSSLKGENIQTIRALNRFKHVVLQMLNETDIKDLQIIDEVSQEEKLRLYENGKDAMTLQETALEIILLLEKSLQKLVLEKRLMIKQAQSTQQNTEQELEKFKIRLENATTACVEQDHMIRRANQRNEMLTRQYNELVVTNNDLQKEIAPCKGLLDKYNSMQREIDRLNIEEKEHAKETKQTIQEFEADRNRLKNELKKLNFTQICQLNAQRSIVMHGKNLHEKIEIIDKAYETNRINIEEHERATEIIEYKNEITNLQFARFVQRYAEFKRMENIKNYLLLLGETYQDEKRFQEFYERYKTREKETTVKWEEKKNEYRKEREKAITLLMKVFDRNQDTKDTEPLMSFPLFERPENAKNVYKRRMMAKRRSIPKFPSTVSDVVGIQLQTSKMNMSYWQMPPAVPSHLIQLSTPRMLEMDVIKCRRPAAMMNRNQLRPAVASFFDTNEQVLL